MAKHIFVTGGVASSLGKGLTASSLGRLLKCRGLKVTMQKLDPYINVDPGTMNPYEHGEVFITADGAETDLDLGHYERFIDEQLTRDSNATTGSIYQKVLADERRGVYLGGTVQVIPHVTNEIKRRIEQLAKLDVDVVITEVGGTVGDIEILPFLEAIRQMRLNVGRENVCYVHVTLVPFIGPAAEQKTKPTQHSVTELRSRGVQPDAVVLRSQTAIDDSLRTKISNLCDVEMAGVINAPDAGNLYEIPMMLHNEGLDDYVCSILGWSHLKPDLTEWCHMLDGINQASSSVRIGLIGKYVELQDAYLSVAESLRHAGFLYRANVEIEWIQAEGVEELIASNGLHHLDGIVIPGGFGKRGVAGKIAAVEYARINDVPCLGLCLGLQVMVIEFCRHVLQLAGADSTEFDESTPHPVIDIMDSQRDVIDMGGTMRLGLYPAKLAPNSQVAALYNATEVQERHRHRYEVNAKYRTAMNEHGLISSGLSPDGSLAEFTELEGHPFWVGTQAHPEFSSRPNRPAPLFCGLIAAAMTRAEGRNPHLLPPPSPAPPGESSPVPRAESSAESNSQRS